MPPATVEQMENVLNPDMRMARGWMTVEIVDNQKDVVPIDEIEPSLNTWMSRGGFISDAHTSRIVGKALTWRKEVHPTLKKEGVLIDYQIFKNYSIDDEVWKEICDGTRTGLSFGGRSLDQSKFDGQSTARKLGGIETYEVASVRRPANPAALNTAVNYEAKGDAEVAKITVREMSEQERDEMYALPTFEQRAQYMKLRSAGKPHHEAMTAVQIDSDASKADNVTRFLDDAFERNPNAPAAWFTEQLVQYFHMDRSDAGSSVARFFRGKLEKSSSEIHTMDTSKEKAEKDMSAVVRLMEDAHRAGKRKPEAWAWVRSQMGPVSDSELEHAWQVVADEEAFMGKANPGILGKVYKSEPRGADMVTPTYTKGITDAAVRDFIDNLLPKTGPIMDDEAQRITTLVHQKWPQVSTKDILERIYGHYLNPSAKTMPNPTNDNAKKDEPGTSSQPVTLEAVMAAITALSEKLDAHIAAAAPTTMGKAEPNPGEPPKKNPKEDEEDEEKKKADFKKEIKEDILKSLDITKSTTPRPVNIATARTSATSELDIALKVARGEKKFAPGELDRLQEEQHDAATAKFLRGG